MSQIETTAVFPNIAPGKVEEFRQIATRVLDKTIPEPGVLHYDWYFSEDETRCEVHEVYADSDAMLAHIANVADLLGPMVELGGGLEAKVFGSPSPELVEALAPFEPAMYSHFQGK